MQWNITDVLLIKHNRWFSGRFESEIIRVEINDFVAFGYTVYFFLFFVSFMIVLLVREYFASFISFANSSTFLYFFLGDTMVITSMIVYHTAICSYLSSSSNEKQKEMKFGWCVCVNLCHWLTRFKYEWIQQQTWQSWKFQLLEIKLHNTDI